jgi:hypothetical protein
LGRAKIDLRPVGMSGLSGSCCMHEICVGNQKAGYRPNLERLVKATGAGKAPLLLELGSVYLSPLRMPNMETGG